MPAYRLEALLDIRTRAEEEAKEAFAEATRALAEQKKKLLQLEQTLAQMKAERKARIQAFLQEMTAKGGAITAFQHMGRFEARLKDEEAQMALQIERQKGVVKQAEKVLEQRRQELTEAAKEKKAIEKHKEEWAKQVRKERMHREDLAQEEIGNTLHLQRSRALERKG